MIQISLQNQKDKIQLCQHSHQNITKICVFPSCKEENPLMCDKCKQSGCMQKHSHNGFRKYIPFQEIKIKFKQIQQTVNIENHLEDVKQELSRLITDFEVMISQHAQKLSGNPYKYKFKPRAQKIVEYIQRGMWNNINGSDLHFINKEQIYDNKNQTFQNILNQKSRVFKVLDSLRKSIGEYYYERERKGINQYLKSASIKKSQSRFQQAIEEYSKVLELYPSHQEALCFRGLCFSFLKKYDRALDDYHHCLKINPRHSQTMSNIGLIYSIRKQKKNALQWYNSSIDLDSNNPITLFNRGVVHMSLGNLEAAKDDFKKALKLAPSRELYQKKAKCHQLLLEQQEALQCIALAKLLKK